MTTIRNLPTLTTITDNTQILVLAEDLQVHPPITKNVSLNTLFSTALNGIVGAQGVHGSQGVQGPIGPAQGIQGRTGLQGTTGSGAQGLQGSSGTQGVQGTIGIQGNRGVQGVQGRLGNQGTSGATAAQGDPGPSGPSGPSGTIISRNNVSGTSSSIADGATATFTITGYKSYSLLRLSTNAGAWVRLYSTSAARTADSSRVQSIDPLPGTGVILDVVTTNTSIVAYSQPITPAVLGFNDDDVPSQNIYVAVTNRSGSTRSISVTLSLLQLEA